MTSMRSRRPTVALSCLALAVAGCGTGDDAAAPVPTATATVTRTVTVTPTPSAPNPDDTPSPDASTPSQPGLDGASDGPFTGGDPAATDTWISDVRSAAQAGYDRVVVEFTGAVPSYTVAYAAPPFVGPSGAGVAVAGQAFLHIRLTGTSSVDLSGSTPTQHYDGPDRVRSDTRMVTEVVQVEDFESVVQWVIGLRSRQPYRVQVFDDPGRLVIDIAQRS